MAGLGETLTELFNVESSVSMWLSTVRNDALQPTSDCAHSANVFVPMKVP